MRCLTMSKESPNKEVKRQYLGPGEGDYVEQFDISPEFEEDSKLGKILKSKVKRVK